MTKTLRIKKIFFDRIFKGEKTVEYRADSDFYRRLFANRSEIKKINFHYQTDRKMTCHVKQIRLIDKPKKIANSPFVKTKKCFAIYLGACQINS